MHAADSIEGLKNQITKLLAAEQPHFGQILELSSRLAALDPNHVRFTADSGLISRLGQELVARQESAVSELVKNAYDADATEVRLVFTGAEKPGGELTIFDNGTGMTRSQLIKGFMRLASTDKVHNPVSPRYGRQRAGRKGIGRFATQRLGTKLELTTETDDDQQALRVRIDWSKFEQERDLLIIGNKIEQVPWEKEEGTTLRIRELREGWTDAQIARIYRYVLSLQQPFPLSKRKRAKVGKFETDPGFKVTFYRRVAAVDIKIASEDLMVFDYALGMVNAEVDASGNAGWTLTSDRLELDDRGNIEGKGTKFSLLKGVHLRAYYFIWDPDLVPGQQLTRLRLLANQQGGIRLYRNGFRVLPYGEPKNDWLGFDDRSRQRSVLFPLANVNWFGFVEVQDTEGERFQETSSREGLANNPAYEQLVAFAGSVLVSAAQRIASERGKKLRAGQKRKSSRSAEVRENILSAIAGDLHDEADAKEGSIVGKTPEQLRDTARRLERVAQEHAELVQENSMLRILASLGLTIGVFTHEVRHQLHRLAASVQDLLKKTLGLKEMKPTLLSLEEQIKLLRSYTAYFDAAIAANVRRDLEPQDLTRVLFDFVDHFRTALTRENSEFVDEEAIEEELLTRPMHPSEWTSILSNLLTNSLKAIRRSKNRGHGEISIRARRDSKVIVVDFLDNGIGIPPENEERVFEPFFTTTTPGSEEEAPEMLGTGLGLKIVRDIISAAEGEIYVAKPPKGFSTCIRIEIPAAEEL